MIPSGPFAFAAASAPVCPEAALSEDQKLMAEPWVSVDDVAKHLGVAKDSVYRWIERKGLPAHRMGRLWKFKISEVDEWVLQGGAAADAAGDGAEPGTEEG